MKTTLKKVAKNTFSICGVGPACPTVKVNKKTVVITDDFGGKITLRKDEFETLKEVNDSVIEN